MKPCRYWLLSFLILLQSIQLVGQNKIPFRVEASDPGERESVFHLLEKISVKNSLSDTFPSTTDQVLNDLLFTCYHAGYLAARFDSVDRLHGSVTAYLKTDQKYEWARVRKGNVDEEFLSLSGFREKLFRGKTVYFEDLVKLEWSIIESCENNGYPFASIRLDSMVIKDHKLDASLHLEKGNLYHVDSLVIKGTADISDIYVRNYLGVKPGTVYNESMVSRIRTRLHEIPFLAESKPMEIAFSEKECKIYLFLERRKASQVNGILGILPDDKKPGKVLVTGEFQLKLQNPFGNGEVMELDWKSLKPRTQDLKTHLLYPFVISRFGLDLGFSIFKQDTTYIDVTKEAGVQYLLPRGNYLKVFVNNKTSSLLSTSGLEYAVTLPPYADVSSTLYGIGIRSEKLDYRLNPRKGLALEGTAAAGTRVITKHPKIPALLYDSIDLRSNQYKGQYTVDYFIPLRSRTILDIGIKGAHLIGNTIFQNELFRFGGLRTLRGFDEESIYASSYDILKVELRYILETNSFFSLFWNGAYYENRSRNYGYDRFDTPYGFGAGIAFDSKLGIFSVNYALGRQFNNPIDIRAGKISFGLLNNF